MNNLVHEINRMEDLRPFRGAWDQLLGETPRADFFRTYNWLETYWKNFGGDQQLRVLVIGRPESPLGIVPLTVRRESTRLGMVRVLTYPLDGWGVNYGPVGPQPNQLLRDALQHIRTTKREWDLLELRWSPGDEASRNETQDALTSAGLNATAWKWGASAVADLAQGWDPYWAQRSAKRRSNVRRNENQLNKMGDLQLERYRPRGARYGDHAPRWDLFDACVQVAQKSWQGDSTTGTTISHEGVEDFLRQTHQTAVDCGALDLNLLWLNERPIAFGYNYVWDNRVFGLRTGFDPEFARQGAGAVLMKRMLEDSAQHGDLEFDLGMDYLGGKRYWLSTVNPLLCYSHYAPSPRAQGIRFKRWLEQSDPWARLLRLRPADAATIEQDPTTVS